MSPVLPHSKWPVVDALSHPIRIIPKGWLSQIARYELGKRKKKQGSFVFIKIFFFI